MKKVLVFFSMFLLLLAFISCGGVTDPGDNGVKPSTGVLFEDGTFSTDLKAPYTWNDNSGILTDLVMAAGQDGNNKNLLVLDWSGVATWDGYVLEATAPFDVSEFNALTFYAKADASYTVEKIGLDAGTSNEIYLADVDLTTSWEKIVIPIPNPVQFSDVGVLFYLLYSVENYSAADKMYIDDIEFELIDGLRPSALALKESDISLEVNGTQNIEEPTLTYTYDDDGEKTINGLSAGGEKPSTLVQYLVCESDDNTKVGVAADGVSITLTGLEETTSDSPVSITCTLGDATDDISVTVTEPTDGTGAGEGGAGAGEGGTGAGEGGTGAGEGGTEPGEGGTEPGDGGAGDGGAGDGGAGAGEGGTEPGDGGTGAGDGGAGEGGTGAGEGTGDDETETINPFNDQYGGLGIEATVTGTGAGQLINLNLATERTQSGAGYPNSDGKPYQDILSLDWSGLTSVQEATYRIDYISSGSIDLNTYYGLSFWAKADADVVIDEIGLHIGDGSQSKEDLSIGTSWEEYTIEFDVSASLAAVQNLFYVTSGATTGTIFFDKIRLIEEKPEPKAAVMIPNAFANQLDGKDIEATVIGTGAEQFSSGLYDDAGTSTVKLSWQKLVSYKDVTYKIDFISSDDAMDLSSYESLSFEARNTGDGQISTLWIDEIGLHIGDDSVFKQNVSITTDWEDFTIDLNPDGGTKDLTNVQNLFYIKLDTLSLHPENIYDILLKDIQFNAPIEDLQVYSSSNDPEELLDGTEVSTSQAFGLPNYPTIKNPDGDNKKVIALSSSLRDSTIAKYQISVPSGGTRDLSAYTTLSFWAKTANPGGGSFVEVGFDSINRAAGLTDPTDRTLTDEWKEFTVTIDSTLDLMSVNNLFYITFNAAAVNSAGFIYIDHIVFSP